MVKSISSGKAPIAIMGIILALTIHESSNMNNQTGFSVFVRIVLFLMIIIYSILRLVKSEEYYHQAVLNASRFDKHGSILVYFANAVICAWMFLTLAVYCIRDLRFNSFFAILKAAVYVFRFYYCN